MTDHAAEARAILRITEETLRTPELGMSAEAVIGAAALGVDRALVHALLALVQALGQPAAGACPSFLLVGSPIFEAPDDEHVYCQHPDGHTGLHANDPDKNDHQFEARWTDWAEGARRLDQEQQ